MSHYECMAETPETLSALRRINPQVESFSACTPRVARNNAGTLSPGRRSGLSWKFPGQSLSGGVPVYPISSHERLTEAPEANGCSGAIVLSTPQCSNGPTQSRPFPARAVKIMESAGQPETRNSRAPRLEQEDQSPAEVQGNQGASFSTIAPVGGRISPEGSGAPSGIQTGRAFP